MGFNAGKARHQVTIEERVTQQDSTGEPELTWNTFAVRRAELMRTPGAEVFAEGRNGRVPTVFKLRFLEGVLPGMRLLCKGKVYDITSAIDSEGMRAELVVTTEELVEETP